MHHTVQYAGRDNAAAQAVQDIREWFGSERFAHIEQLYRSSDPVPLDIFRLQMSFAGVEGYPVTVWHAELWPAVVELDAEDYTVIE